MFSVCLWMMLPIAASADEPFPGEAPSRDLLRMQEKADVLFESGKYDRALIIYRDELSPRGDKYAQYMVGYIYLAGKGVGEDPVIASAWYRLAAERANDKFVNVSQRLLERLSAEQRARSDAVFADLQQQFGDAHLMARLIEQDLAILVSRRAPLTFQQQTVEGDSYATPGTLFADTAERLQHRVGYLDRLLETDGKLPGTERDEYSQLLVKARRAVEAYQAGE